jgi:hypothetical protein
MRTLLRKSQTGAYFQGLENWTANPTEAFDFKWTDRAIRFVRDAGLQHVEVVFAFDDPSYDVKLPVDERFDLSRSYELKQKRP